MTPRRTLQVRSARSASEVALVRTLFEEYGRSVSVDLEYEHFADEVRSLPGAYAPPHGDLLLATVDGAAAGCVGIRPLPGRVGEMKRLFVRPPYRGEGVGRALAVAVVRSARALGYRALRLDTLSDMTRAAALYAALGFREIPPYRYNPAPGVRFFELDLAATAPPRSRGRGTNK
jgi:putative acetyltransferase